MVRIGNGEIKTLVISNGQVQQGWFACRTLIFTALDTASLSGFRWASVPSHSVEVVLALSNKPGLGEGEMAATVLKEAVRIAEKHFIVSSTTNTDTCSSGNGFQACLQQQAALAKASIHTHLQETGLRASRWVFIGQAWSVLLQFNSTAYRQPVDVHNQMQQMVASLPMLRYH